MKIIKITNNDVNIRLDNFICKLYPNLTKANIYKAIRTKNIKVNKLKCLINYKLKLNDEIQIFIDDKFLSNKTDELFLQAKSILEIVFEDDNLLVVNKPYNLLVYDEKEMIADTLINRAKKYLYTQNKWDYSKENQFAPALLHRLDYNTTGLVMIAKNHETLVILNEKIKNQEVDKYYLCMVHGKVVPNSALLQAYWLKDEAQNIVKITATPVNRSVLIKTFYKVMAYDQTNDYSTLEVKLITGKTHQIRAHLAFIGHPLVGEQKYTNKIIEKDNNHKSQALVSYKIVFDFKSDARILNYLNHQTIILKVKDRPF